MLFHCSLRARFRRFYESSVGLSSGLGVHAGSTELSTLVMTNIFFIVTSRVAPRGAISRLKEGRSVADNMTNIRLEPFCTGGEGQFKAINCRVAANKWIDYPSWRNTGGRDK